MLNEPFPKFESEAKELKKIATAKGMELLFNTLKGRGLFKEFSSYQKWCETKEILNNKIFIKR